ncbi:hypothetical protein [Nocardioides sp.]|uniref:hypothetical protein n=1 Tax=Nocardioides sp. TaxID=35761 RepID=UPI00286B749D|nr:hypothetical protein [Nocardioides sp.]
MRRKPPLPLALGLSLVKSVVLLVVVALGFGLIGGGQVTASPGTGGADQIEERSAVIEKAMAEHECSTTGFAAGVIPRSALIRRDDRVRQVSFDEGWDIVTGEAPGVLIAVCLGELAMPRTSGVPAS